MIKVLSMSFNLLKRTVWIATIATMSCWMMPAVAELSVNNSQSVMLSKNASENQYFTQTIRLMKNPKEFELFEKLRFEQDIINVETTNIPKKYEDLGIGFEFATVEGNLFGDVTGRKLAQITVESQSKIILSLPKFIDAKVANMPKLIINDYGIPVNFARLSSLSNNTLSSKMSGAEFVDGITGNLIFLVYASDKMEISGQIMESDIIYDHNIKIPAQGWYWVQEERLGNSHTYTQVDSTDIDPIIFAL